VQTAVSSIAGRTIVSVTGPVDRAGSETLSGTLERVIQDDTHNVVIDLSGVTLLDAAGLGTIVRGRKALRETGRDLSVRLPSWTARQSLEMSGLGSLIEEPSQVGLAEARRRPPNA
jgi:anti-anti-sigma factor